jgi:hypothetical protein
MKTPVEPVVMRKSDVLQGLSDFFDVRSSLVYSFSWVEEPPLWARDVFVY